MGHALIATCRKVLSLKGSIRQLCGIQGGRYVHGKSLTCRTYVDKFSTAQKRAFVSKLRDFEHVCTDRLTGSRQGMLKAEGLASLRKRLAGRERRGTASVTRIWETFLISKAGSFPRSLESTFLRSSSIRSIFFLSQKRQDLG